MTIKEVKHVAIEFTPEDDNSIKKVYNLMRELSNALAKYECTILSGNDYEVPIDISIERLEETIEVVDSLKYITEMF